MPDNTNQEIAFPDDPIHIDRPPADPPRIAANLWPAEVAYQPGQTMLTSFSAGAGIVGTYATATIPIYPINYDFFTVRDHLPGLLRYNYGKSSYEYPLPEISIKDFVNAVALARDVNSLDRSVFRGKAVTLEKKMLGVGMGVGGKVDAGKFLKVFLKQIAECGIANKINDANKLSSASTDSFIHSFTNGGYRELHFSNFNPKRSNILIISGNIAASVGIAGISLSTNLVIIGTFESFFHYVGGITDFYTALNSDEGEKSSLSNNLLHAAEGALQATLTIGSYGTIPILQYFVDVISKSYGFFCVSSRELAMGGGASASILCS